ncbi:MAG: hypothetical protein NUW02_03260 [Candidatus Campbellbacteria bacterium]|nr:hypothetical protein [Candidatus Campbellbacteria bacterium]
MEKQPENFVEQGYTISDPEPLTDKLEKLPIELFPERSKITISELREIIPDDPIVVCDFYVEDIEKGEELESGYRQEDVTNIDHHAPGALMARQISSTNLAIQFVEKNGVMIPPVHVVVNHVDCDSVLSSSIMRGILSPDQKFGEAAIAADHTGAQNEIADLLQSLQDKRSISFSLTNLEKLLKGEPVDEEAEQMLNKRLQDRKRAKEIITDGKFNSIGDVYFTSVNEKFDAGLLPALLPDAIVILLGSPMKDNPERWEIKIRLGMKAPEGLTLNTLNLPDFGGRWNAGSTKRAKGPEGKGGTTLNPEEYAVLLDKIIKEKLESK